jgi:hypothetical protein
MSFDLQIDQVCRHEVTEEALFVAADRRTVRPIRPISSAASVKVLLNNAVSVPSEGVLLPASTSGTKRGPFSITTGVDDTLELAVNQGDVQTGVLPALDRMGASRIAALLNKQFTGIVFSVVNERLALTTREKGPASSIFLEDTSTAASVFGFAAHRNYRGHQLVPGWTLIGDPTTLEDRPTRLIIFDEPLRSASDFVEISYVTLREECRRCGGVGVEHDWRYDTKGEVIEVRDEALLLQELQKDFYTIEGSNPFHTWYGTQLIESIGKKLIADFAQNIITSDLYQAFNRWQSVKRQQEEDVGQFVSDREFPFKLLSVVLEQSVDDPTVIFVTATVQNRSNEAIELSRGLKLPEELQLGTIRQSISGTALSG